jgi:hypothetical protein
MAIRTEPDYQGFLELIAIPIAGELRRQDKKWGEPRHHPDYWFAIAAEEFGEVAQGIVERNPRAVREEIIQTIACLVRLMTALPDSGETWR